MRGRILIESIVSLGIGSIAVTALASLFTTITHTAAKVSKAHSSIVATTKVYAALSAALRTHERNRLSFATQIVRAPPPRSPGGTTHPLATLRGASGPREGSDILTLIEVAYRCRGVVTQATMNNSDITATICGLTCRIQPDEFKSFLLYAIDGARQITGEIAMTSQTCAEVRGTSLDGMVTTRRAFTSPPLVFAPVDREYSLFVDTTDTFRIASHVGMRIVENQPVSQGIEAIHIGRKQHGDGVSTFAVVIRPRVGKELSTFVTPSLAQRFIWNEVLP